MNRRALVLGSIGGLVAIVAACTFPDVGFKDDGTISETPQDAGSETGSLPTDGGLVDVESRSDATSTVDANSCADTDCDCDKDKYLRADCDAGVEDAGPVDCDDLDPLRHPNAIFSDEVPATGQEPPGDWNCNDDVEKAYPIDMVCTGLLCGSNAKGFKDDPGCGVAADFYQCVAAGLGLGCEYAYVGSQKQACR